MPDTAVDLVFPGDPFVYPVVEQEPVPSRYTGRMLRRLLVSMRARSDDLDEQIEAMLSESGARHVVVSERSGGRWKVTSHGSSYQVGQVGPVIHNVELEEVEELSLERVEFERAQSRS